ncbi:MAG: cupin domain-containing protein [Pedobacter agri]|uniref:Cupin domain-containing protein n=1 Tax=Pedobacter agri TaxID=454586 RepID=A0A9X3I729_9SPHI|nr:MULTISPECIES: cupin domain-containing protein [Pedobacter]AZI26145.1 cupin domain-containing protein [Pedobacter sp. G11]MCX3263321.1 cupin domain-containing protein [Pedobacter agri]
MKNVFYLFLLMMLAKSGLAQETPIFPRGEISKTNNHTGDVWLTELNKADSVIDCALATATFAPGAKLDWHIHPAGQILIITEGTGYYQEKGKAIQVVHKGDIIKCVPGVPHWHGASPKSIFSYIAASTNGAKNKTVWLQRVSDAEYNNLKQ